MTERFRKTLAPLAILFLFIAALWLLERELQQYHWSDIQQSIAKIPRVRLLGAFLLTVVSYGVLIAYDGLGIFYVKRKLAFPKIMLVSVLGFAVANNFGTLLGGSSVRLRLYSAWGFSAVDIVKLLFVMSLTFWIGLFGLSGFLFIVHPLVIPEQLHLPVHTTVPLGIILFGITLIYLFLCMTAKKPLRIRGWEIELPNTKLSLLQLLVAGIDLTIAGWILFLLMPESLHINFVTFLGIYLLALVAAILSHVPGGVGIFELLMIVLLAPPEPQDVLGGMLVYRVIYYLLPLMLGLTVLAFNEILLHRKHLGKIATILGRWTKVLAPRFLSLSTFAGGFILLASGATPSDSERLRWIQNFLPVPVIEVSHWIGSVVGLLLLVLARSLQRRVETAYYLGILLLSFGIVSSLLKGGDYEEALILSFILLAFIPCREHFYRRSVLVTERLTLPWFVAIGIVFACMGWLMLFAFKHVEYSHEMWWQFALEAQAPRSLRALASAVLVLLAIASNRLLTTRPSPPGPTTPDEWKIIERLVQASAQASSNLALLGDKHFMIHPNHQAFLMYGIEGKSWVTMGDAVGEETSCRELVWNFRELCQAQGSWPVFYQVDPNNLPLYVEMGLTVIKLGEEATVPLKDFDLEGRSRKSLRKTWRQCQEQECTFEVLRPDQGQQIQGELREISDEWLSRKHAAEKGFSLGFFSEDYLARCPIAIVRVRDRIVAFANLWVTQSKAELSMDLMRTRADAPKGCMEFLLVELMLWGKTQEYDHFSLGMAPLSGVEQRPFGPFWNRIAALVYAHGERFYNFRGLRQYKDKFDPQWTPKYLASPGGMVLPVILTQVTTLISGGFLRLLRRS